MNKRRSTSLKAARCPEHVKHNIGNKPRQFIAELDYSGTTGWATTWNPNSNSSFSGMFYRAGALYVSGYFTSIGGQTRNRLAALDASGSTGWATSWI